MSTRTGKPSHIDLDVFRQLPALPWIWGVGAIAQSVERAAHGEEVVGWIPTVAACSLLVELMSV